MPLRSLDPSQPHSQILFYRVCYWLVMLVVTLLYRFRIFGAGNLPRDGGLLVVCNHQSHWDPPILGVSLRYRNMASIGREGLFRVPVLSQIIRGLGCIPIKEDEGDAGAIRAAIAELKKGRVMLIFPEGTRTPDGEIKEFKRGAWVLLSRARVDVLPAAIEGAFDSWPRSDRLPALLGHRIAVSLGAPIRFEELKALGPERGLARLREEVGRLHAELVRGRARTDACRAARRWRGLTAHELRTRPGPARQLLNLSKRTGSRLCARRPAAGVCATARRQRRAGARCS